MSNLVTQHPIRLNTNFTFGPMVQDVRSTPQEIEVVVPSSKGPKGDSLTDEQVEDFVEEYFIANPINVGTIHTQSAPAATWTILHDLGRTPNTQVFLESGEEVFADVVANDSQVVITFPSPMAGKALLI